MQNKSNAESSFKSFLYYIHSVLSDHLSLIPQNTQVFLLAINKGLTVSLFHVNCVPCCSMCYLGPCVVPCASGGPLLFCVLSGARCCSVCYLDTCVVLCVIWGPCVVLCVIRSIVLFHVLSGALCCSVCYLGPCVVLCVIWVPVLFYVLSGARCCYVCYLGPCVVMCVILGPCVV